jgi:hypothetical protein
MSLPNRKLKKSQFKSRHHIQRDQNEIAFPQLTPLCSQYQQNSFL